MPADWNARRQFCFTLEVRIAMTKTFHVYPSDAGWVVRKEGRRAETYPTQREAVDAARQSIKDSTQGQLVIHKRDGSIRDHQTYGMPRVQDPPKKSRLAKQIERAVEKVTLEGIQPDSNAASGDSSQK